MYIKMDFDFNDLKRECWSGAEGILQRIASYDKEIEFFQLLDELYYDECPTLTEINDFLRFDDEYIYECLGIPTERQEEVKFKIDNDFDEDFVEWVCDENCLNLDNIEHWEVILDLLEDEDVQEEYNEFVTQEEEEE